MVSTRCRRSATGLVLGYLAFVVVDVPQAKPTVKSEDKQESARQSTLNDHQPEGNG